MFISKRHIPRRTVLRGMGATVALPLLDAMVPAATAQRDDRSEREDPPRGHRDGARRRRLARSRAWPSTTGRRSRTGPTSSSRSSLTSLEPFRDYVTIVSDTDLANAEALSCAGGRRRPQSLVVGVPDGEPSASGPKAPTLRRRPRSIRSTPRSIRPGHAAAVDPVVHRERRLDLRRLRLRLQLRVLRRPISWASPTMPLPMERDPRVDVREPVRPRRERPPSGRRADGDDRSILDAIRERVAQAARRSWRRAIARRLNEYLDSVREIERRLQNDRGANVKRC